MVEVFAVRELFKFFIDEEVTQTYATSRETHVSVHQSEGDCLDLLELRLVQSSLHEVQPVLIESLDSLLPLLCFLLDISLGIFVEFVIYLMYVHSPQ